MTSKTKYFLISLTIMSLASPLISTIVSMANTCAYAMDFPIYQQAIYDSFSLKNINPYLTIRDIHILKDHFDPIFLLAGPWASLFNYSPFSLLVFEWIFLAATLWGIFFHSNKINNLLLWFFLFLWNRGVLDAMGYPIHPTTWSMLPMTMALISLKENKQTLFWISTLSLLFFKEIFPIATLSLSLAMTLKKDYRKGLPLLAISIFFCLFNFQWRYWMLEGDNWNYSKRFASFLFNDFSIQSFTNTIKSAIKVFLPGFVVLYWTIVKKSFSKTDFFILSFWLPLFGIHFVYQLFGAHYALLISWPPMLLLWNKEFLLKDKRVLVTLIIACVYTGFGTHKRNYLTLFQDTVNQHCEISPAKRDSIRNVRAIIDTLPLEKTLLSTVGTIPLILRPKAKVYVIDGFSKRLNQYDYLLIGLNSFPVDVNKMKELKKTCLKKNPNKILFNDKYHLLVKGPVTYECLPVNAPSGRRN